MDSNDRTLGVYNRNVDAYIEHIPAVYPPEIIQWIDYILTLVPQGASILELGSATTRDSNYMRSKGCSVICSDGSKGFVERLQSQGEPAIELNVLKDDLPQGFDLVFANAVVPHFTPKELGIVLDKVYGCLNPGGIFAFNAKSGTGEQWVNEKFHEKRFMHFWQTEDLQNLTVKSGYKIINIVDGLPGQLPTHTWIRVHAQKP